MSLIEAFATKESPVTNRMARDHNTDLMVSGHKKTGSLNKAFAAKGSSATNRRAIDHSVDLMGHQLPKHRITE